MEWRGVSSRLNFKTLFEPWELELAERLVRRFCGRGKAFPDSEFETLLSDVLGDWYFERSQYDAARQSSRAAFMKTVVERDLTDRARAEKTLKRSALKNAIPLNEPLDDDENSLTREEVLPDPCDPLGRGVADLGFDLDKVTRRLSARQKLILKLYSERLPVTEIAALLKISRSTAHEEIARIRKLFESAGLRDYLK
jgi:DNA-directed RNA polymerase specialized sigma24 family protein